MGVIVFDHMSHHSQKDLGVSVDIDALGREFVIRGKGFRHVNIYELINSLEDISVWIETTDREVVWESWLVRYRAGKKKTGPQTLAQIETIRDRHYPHCRVVAWQGSARHGSFVLWDEPVTVTARKKK